MSHVLGLEHIRRRFIAQTQNSRGNQWHSLEQIPQWWALRDWRANHQEAKHSQERIRRQKGSVNADISVCHTHIVRLTSHSVSLSPLSCNSKQKIVNKTRQAKICQTAPPSAQNSADLRQFLFTSLWRWKFENLVFRIIWNIAKHKTGTSAFNSFTLVVAFSERYGSRNIEFQECSTWLFIIHTQMLRHCSNKLIN